MPQPLALTVLRVCVLGVAQVREAAAALRAAAADRTRAHAPLSRKMLLLAGGAAALWWWWWCCCCGHLGYGLMRQPSGIVSRMAIMFADAADGFTSGEG